MTMFRPSALLVFTLACGGAQTPVPAPSPVPAAKVPAPAAVPAPRPALAKKLPPPFADAEPLPDDCTLDPDWAKEGILDPNQKDGKLLVEKGPGALSETVTFDDGVQVRVVRGGCYHVGESWMVSPILPKAPPWPAAKAARARVVIAEGKKDEVKIDTCIAAIPESPEATFSPSDFVSCAGEVNNGILSVSWDFAM